MNYKMMSRFIGQMLLIEAAFMLPALLISVLDGDENAVYGFLAATAITTAVGGMLLIFGKNAKYNFYAKEGLLCVGISWIAFGILGSLPFVFSKEIPSFIDALFETISGFTTTGASILSEVESLSRGILYWRSFTHWLGGMGVLVFLLAIVPGREGKSGFTMHLLRAESPGPNVGKLVPKMRDTARILYIIYIVLTVLDILLLLLGKMPLFDAICTGFGTAGTGGFGIKNDSIAGYSPYIQNVCTVFMILFGVNFNCYYLILLKQIKNVFKDEEFRFYIIMVLVSIMLISWNIRGLYGSWGETVRYAAFQVGSLVSSTGFATANFGEWPGFSKSLLLFLMFVGASAGSTGGGFKCGRTVLLIKNFHRGLMKELRPQQVQVVRMNGNKVDEKILQTANVYLIAYVLIYLVSFLLISIDGHSITTNVTAVLACLNNIGPGLDLVGPSGNYACFGVLSKLVLIFDMLAGRLEIFPMLILFSRATWKKG